MNFFNKRNPYLNVLISILAFTQLHDTQFEGTWYTEQMTPDQCYEHCISSPDCKGFDTYGDLSSNDVTACYIHTKITGTIAYGGYKALVRDSC